MSMLHNNYTLEGVSCPACDESLCQEETITELCGDPFNGIQVDCPGCSASVSLSLRASATVTVEE